MSNWPWVEVKPVNPNTTDREFVHVNHVQRLYRDTEGHWYAWLFDGTSVPLLRGLDAEAPVV